MEAVFYDRYSPNGKREFEWKQSRLFSDENTSEADYVWLPIRFDENGSSAAAFAGFHLIKMRTSNYAQHYILSTIIFIFHKFSPGVGNFLSRKFLTKKTYQI
ncbi:MAG: hypothetical protein IJZ83_07890 [Clostridia bacterium]|nr:hypothetical protein [Clostridia bacterium]